MMDMNKLLLSHDDSIMSLEALQLSTFILPKSSPCMEAGKSEGQKYHQQVTSMAKEELQQKDLGPTHTYIVLATLKSLSAHHTKEGNELSMLRDLIKRMEEAHHREATKIIPYFKIGKTYEEDYKVRVHCQSSQDMNCLSWYLQLEGGKEKVGKATRGKLARDCQTWLK